MRTISMRKFRDNIADQTEPVIVQRRDKAGYFRPLGVWHPLDGPGASNYQPTLAPDAKVFGDTSRYYIAPVVAEAYPFTPVPKPARRK